MNPKFSTAVLKVLSHMLTLKPAPMIEGERSLFRIANYCKINDYNKVLVITSSILAEMDWAKEFYSSLEKKDIDFVVYDKADTEPTFSLAREILSFAGKFSPDCVVAIGGGSVIDVAKLICAGLEKPDKPLEKFAGILKVFKMKPLIAVPTTAGTGSETTFISVITGDDGVKKTIVSPKIIPNLAVLDGNLTKSLPTKLTASTGIDALSHAVESYISTCDKKSHDHFAPMATSLIFQYLKKSCDEPENGEYRLKMLKASYLAGNAMNNEMVGYAHAFAHQLGSFYHISHGEAIAMCLVNALKFQLSSAKNKFSKLCKMCGFVRENEDEMVSAQIFIDKVDKLIKSLGLKQKCSKLERKDYGKIIENAFYETARRYPMSRFMTTEEAVAFLDQIKGEDDESDSSES